MFLLPAFLFLCLFSQAMDRPVLFLSDKRLEDLKEFSKKDQVLKGIILDVLKKADKDLDKPPLVYNKIGPRLLHVSRDCLQRTYSLCLAWRITGDKKYAETAKNNLLDVCAFKDWNPSHFLDTAEMSHAVGVGYDWLFSILTEEEKVKLRQGLIRLGLKPGLNAYKNNAWWARSAFNWNQVCNCGLMIGALSIKDTDPDFADTIIPNAIKSLPKALDTYLPHGAWPEGPGYWNYATTYTVFGLAALNSVLGHDFGLSEHKGLRNCGFYPLAMCGAKNLYFNFADCGETSLRKTLPALFWFARKYDLPYLAQKEHEALEDHGAHPLHLIWYYPISDSKGNAAPPHDQLFKGPVETAVFKSESLVVFFKAGFNQVNHGHLDLGSFVLDAMGERWVTDLGADNYNLPGYWDKGKKGKRWSYYRLNTFSHNTLLLDQKGQDPMGTSKFLSFNPGDGIIDLTSAYQDRSRKTVRRFKLENHRKELLIEDKMDLKKACEAAFGITTKAGIRIGPKNTAVLSKEEKKLEVTILEPRDAEFSLESCEQAPPQRANKDARRLMIRYGAPKGSFCFKVLFKPCSN